jgi:hypothetical protein
VPCAGSFCLVVSFLFSVFVRTVCNVVCKMQSVKTSVLRLVARVSVEFCLWFGRCSASFIRLVLLLSRVVLVGGSVPKDCEFVRVGAGGSQPGEVRASVGWNVDGTVRNRCRRVCVLFGVRVVVGFCCWLRFA